MIFFFFLPILQLVKKKENSFVEANILFEPQRLTKKIGDCSCSGTLTNSNKNTNPKANMQIGIISHLILQLTRVCSNFKGHGLSVRVTSRLANCDATQPETVSHLYMQFQAERWLLYLTQHLNIFFISPGKRTLFIGHGKHPSLNIYLPVSGSMVSYILHVPFQSWLSGIQYIYRTKKRLFFFIVLYS